MAQFWLDYFIRVEYDVMNCCSIAQPHSGQVNIEHNNGDDDDGQGDDRTYIMTMFTIIDDQDNDLDYDHKPWSCLLYTSPSPRD